MNKHLSSETGLQMKNLSAVGQTT